MEKLEMILDSEMARPRRDGLSTELRKIAKKLSYKFVVHHRSLIQGDNEITYKNVRGCRGGFIFDHYFIHIACDEALQKIKQLQATVDALIDCSNCRYEGSLTRCNACSRYNLWEIFVSNKEK